MPIPRLGNSGRKVNSGAVARPTESAQSAGRVGNAVAGLAGQVAEIGAGLEKRRKQVETKDFADGSLRELRSSLSQIDKDVSREFEGNPQGRDEQFKIRSEARLKELSDSAPSDEASRLFSGRAADTVFSANNRFQAATGVKTIQFQRADRDKQSKQLGQSQIVDPDPERAARESLIFKAETESRVGLHYDSEEVRKTNQRNSQDIRSGLVTGLVNHGVPFVNKTLPLEEQEKQVDAFFESDSAKIVFEGAGPLELNSASKKFKNRLKLDNNREQKKLVTEAQQAINLISAGGDLEVGLQAELDAAVAKTDNIQDPKVRERVQTQIISAQQLKGVKSEAKYLNVSELNSFFADESKVGGDNIEGALASKKLTSLKRRAVQEELLLREKDGAAYIQSRFPGTKDPVEAVALQKDLGIRNVRVLNKGTAALKAASILEKPTANLRVGELDKLQEEYGDLTAQAVTELSESNPKITGGYILATNFSTPQAREALIKVDMNKTAIVEAAKADGRTLSNIKPEVYKEAANFVRAANSFGSENTTQKIVDSIALHALDSDDVKGSVKQIIDREFHTFDDRDFVVPTKFGVSKRHIEAWLDGAKSKESLMALGVSADREVNFDANFQESKHPGFTPQTLGLAGPDVRDPFFREVSNNVTFVNTKSLDGVHLLFTSQEGKVKKLRDSKGNVIEVKFRNMVTDQRTLDNLN